MSWRHPLALVLVALIAEMATPAVVLASDCNGTQTGLVPLTALGPGTYQGYTGGLYPGGSNTRPAAHDAVGLAIAAAIAPIDTFGNADPNGRVVLISIGMSNCAQEFSAFVPASNTDPSRDPGVRVINCARGGQTASLIKDPGYAYWDTVRAYLRGVGSSPAQVQVVWLKEANARPTTGFPAATTTLMQDLGSVVRTLKDHFPNVRITYLSSRTYAGYASTPLNPEPYAYESGFAVKWLIEGQIAGEDSLNHDPLQGAVEAPWLAWGPYLWADGLDPRPEDGLTWACSDFVASDGTHPSASGRTKVAGMLLDFLHTDATAQPWYLAATASVAPAVAPVLSLRIAPNPAAREVEVAFATRHGERWKLEVLDLAGRRVRALAEGVGDGSAHAVLWDARGRPGARLRAGVYWVHLESGSAATARRVALLGSD